MPFEIPWGLEDDTAACSQVGFLPLWLSGEGGEHFAVVDEDDFVWASRWRWQIKRSKNGKKIYACRSSHYEGRRVSIFLHKQICLRAHGRPPSPRHIIADHEDGNSQNMRRGNLRWATPSENRQNYNGIYALQLRLDFKDNGARLLRSHTFGGNNGHQAEPRPVRLLRQGTAERAAFHFSGTRSDGARPHRDVGGSAAARDQAEEAPPF